MGRFISILRNSDVSVALLIVAWVALTATGLSALMVYSQTPGTDRQPPGRTEIDLPRVADANQFELFLAMHPRCPCTRSTLSELARMLRFTHGRMHVTVLAYRPANQPDSFTHTDLKETASGLPETRVLIDPGGSRARQLRMSTSGAVALYSPEGEPLFFGGITASRGHEGANAGSDAVVALVNNLKPITTHTNVYGCPILVESTLTANQARCAGGKCEL